MLKANNLLFIGNQHNEPILVVLRGKTDIQIGVIATVDMVCGAPTDDDDIVIFGYDGELNDILPNGASAKKLLEAIPAGTYADVKQALNAFFTT